MPSSSRQGCPCSHRDIQTERSRLPRARTEPDPLRVPTDLDKVKKIIRQVSKQIVADLELAADKGPLAQ